MMAKNTNIFELLHAVAKEEPENLKRNDNYDYMMLERDEVSKVF